MKRTPLLFLIFLCACVPYKDTLYLRNLDSTTEPIAIREPEVVKLMPGDLVEIFISSISKETNTYFQKQGSDEDTNAGANLYQLDTEGMVELPLLGTVSLAGLTTSEAEGRLRNLLIEYLQKPVVNIRRANFNVTVLGEVKNAGLYKVPQTQANILQVLALAGDITVYGKKSDVLLIRNYGDDKQYVRMDLRDAAVLTSEFYHLQHNDIVYVPPTRGRTAADDNVYRLLPLVLSGLTFVAVIISLTQ